jgi:hypothetical protein
VCGGKFSIVRRAAEDIDAIRGTSWTCKRAHDQAVFVKSDGVNSAIVGIEAAAIDDNRGKSVIFSVAKDHAVDAMSFGVN